MPSHFIKALIIIGALLVPRLAFAQYLYPSTDDGVLHIVNPPKPIHQPTGDGDLDHAVAICDAHLTLVPYMEGPQWTIGMEGCDAVMSAWSNSKAETDRRDAEAKRKVDADRAFVAQFVKGLPK